MKQPQANETLFSVIDDDVIGQFKKETLLTYEYDISSCLKLGSTVVIVSQ